MTASSTPVTGTEWLTGMLRKYQKASADYCRGGKRGKGSADMEGIRHSMPGQAQQSQVFSCMTQATAGADH